ncbi:hypothetical protein N0V82_009202 [Gnomoniopsis sp. IMI 355080]|nr:hypothetical protein N0V82_009202 [Gnomoniopsis sp. IMI 355080]
MRHSLMAVATALLSFTGAVAAAGLTNDSMTTYVDSLTLTSSFDPVIAAYWTGYKHHRRTPFAVSPDGSVAYLAYLDSSASGVHVQAVDPSTFKATGTPTTVSGGKEAGGLVALDDGFALLTNEAMPSTTTNAPPSDTPVPVLYRFDASGTQKWKTWLGGPDIDDEGGHMCAPDMNGDLVYSNTTGRFAAYTVVTAYDGDYSGHFGDAIRYVEDSTGAIVNIDGASSSWGCSHNTGIALEAADAAPYASVCAEDQGAIWLNSKGQGMTTEGTKISNENTTNGAGGESLGGMSGSYSNLARWQNGDGYIFAWVSRGAIDLYENAWMGAGYTAAYNRTNGRNVAIATFTDKYTMVEEEASSTVGAASGDSQVTWVTKTTTADMSNAHVATFDSTTALVTWEEIADPHCDFIAFGCQGTFTGASYQFVSSDGSLVGDALVTTDVTVSGDLVTMPDGRICWPYVNQAWDLAGTVDSYGSSTSTTVTKMSFACVSADGSSGSSSTGAASSAAAASSTAATTSSSVVASSSADAVVAAASASTTSATTSAAQPATTLQTSLLPSSASHSCQKHTKTVYVTAQ